MKIRIIGFSQKVQILLQKEILLMKAIFSCITVFLLITSLGCGGDKVTEPEEKLDLTPVEFAPLLNTQAGLEFAQAPWDVNDDGNVDLFDLVIVSNHFGEDVEVSGEVGTGRILEIINKQQANKTIQVTGSGAAVGEPDVVLLSLGVSVERESVKQARADAAEAMQGVIDSLKGNGVADLDIQTQHFSIHQQFDFVNGRREFRGYNVTNTVSAKIRDLDVVGQAIDDAAEAGGDLVQINSIQFSIDDTAELRMQARVAAMQNAQAKAQTLATEGGVMLGKPISISEGGSSFVSQPFARGLAEDAGVATPIESGQLQVNVTVNVVYEIE
jgi:uncharacterized protein YggE